MVFRWRSGDILDDYSDYIHARNNFEIIRIITLMQSRSPLRKEVPNPKPNPNLNPNPNPNPNPNTDPDPNPNSDLLALFQREGLLIIH